jgi:hypothetical protein
MFLFLTPILIVLVIYKNLFEKQNRNFYLTSFLFGLAALAYGSFVLYLPVLLCSFLYFDRNFTTIYSNKINYILHGVLFLLPTCSWIFICKHFSGQYYNHEVVRFRELVWVIDAIKIGFFALTKATVINILTFLFISIRAVLPFLITWFILQRRIISLKIKIEDKNIYILLNITLFVFTGFFAVLGYYAYRLSFSISILILVIIALQLNTLLLQQPNLKAKLIKQMKICILFWCVLNLLFYVV